MGNILSEWVKSHFPLYTADGIHSLYSTSDYPVFNIDERLVVIIAVASGNGTLTIGNQAYELTEGSVILLPSYSNAVLAAPPAQPLHAYKLLLGTREQTRPFPAGAMIRTSEVASSSTVTFVQYEPAIVAWMEELYMHRLPAHEARHVWNQIIFHQIVLKLLEHQEARFAVNEEPSMGRSIDYLENHFHDKISREQLASIAGVSPSHYSFLFKQITGFSPNEYLSRLRLHRAMELLISGSGTLREIALKVGYKDEFYLSRRFKQQTGAAPSGYNRVTFQRVAVLLAPYSSHLLLLGLEPSVTISESSEYLNAADMEPPQSMFFLNTDSSAEQVTSILIEKRIELIVAANEHFDQYGLNPRHLRAAAPIVEISWMGLGWKDHLRLIARAIQRSDRAETWLAAFEREEREGREMLHRHEADKETVSIFVIKPDKLLVYGARNAGYVIYQSLGLQPPAIIAREIKQHGERFHSLPIELSELLNYAGDRLLVIVFPDERGSTAHSELVFRSPYWLSLPAVEGGRVSQLEMDDWIPYNPVSIRLQLHRAIALFTGHQ